MKPVLNENELMEFLSKMTKNEIRECFGNINLNTPWDVVRQYKQDVISFYITMYRNKTEDAKIPLEALYGFNFSVYCDSHYEATDLLYQLNKAGFIWASGDLLQPYKNEHDSGRYYVYSNKTVSCQSHVYSSAKSDLTFSKLIVKSSVGPEELESYITMAKEMNNVDFAECFEIPDVARMELDAQLLIREKLIEGMKHQYLKRKILNWKERNAFQVGDIVRIVDRSKIYGAENTPEEGFICYISDDLEEMYICFMNFHEPIRILYSDRQYVENTGRKIVVKNA